VLRSCWRHAVEKKFWFCVALAVKVCILVITRQHERKAKQMTTTHQIQKLGIAGYNYRGLSITKRNGSRGRRYYEVNVTKLVTEQYRAQFYKTVDTFKFTTNTVKDAVANIDEMFDNGDLA